VDAAYPTASTLQRFNPSTKLTELIRDRIHNHGPVSFAWFMDQALYHPEFGYYASDRAEIGRKGDYFTNVSVGSLFGRLLAAQFAEIWGKLGQVRDFTIVEQGAHHGQFAADVLASIRDNSPDLFGVLRYRVIEPFTSLQARQRQTLAEFRDKVIWRDSVDALEPFVGIHFSNELLDSFPVHLIVSQCKRDRESGRGLSAATSPTSSPWLEKCVALKDDQLVFVERPIANAKLRAAAQGLPVQPAGYTTEVNLAALEWLENISAKLTRGYIFAVDYGYTRENFYGADRTDGTLQIRAKHRSLESPFQLIGQADISAHVDWTSLAERAGQRGLHVAGFADQHHFLTGIVSERPELVEQASPKTARGLQTLLHPEMLGRTFQVLALTKDIDTTTKLSGFKFARNARVTLGL
jgi:SAM-dependent MidA family methyltransferase